MEAKSLGTLAAITALIAGAVAMSGPADQGDHITEAAGAAIKGVMAEIIEYESDPAAREAEAFKGASLCVTARVPLDFAVLAERLTGTFLLPVPAGNCSTKIVEGDFGMFSAMTTWFDESGREAGHLDIRRITCPTVTRCLVDIDMVGAGMSYTVERKGRGWSVWRYDLRWVV